MTLQDFGLSIIASWIADKINKNSTNNNIKKFPKQNYPMENVTLEETEVEKLSKRFKTIIELMNQKRNECDKFTIAKISEILGLEKRSILENIVNGKNEPSFEFIKNFCDKFRVNYSWLNEGKGEPFNISHDYYNPFDYLDDIIRMNPKKIYFIQEKSEVAVTFIMLEFSDWYYMVGTKTWHISSHVGASGRGQIYGLYCLIKALKENMFYAKCHGLILPVEEFSDILYGKKFPGSCLIGRNNNPWWDDFTDIAHYCPIASEYEKWYGKSFIDAQKIVKYQIENRS